MSYRRVHPRRRAFSIKTNLTSGYPNLIRDISIVSTTLASAVVVGHVFLTYFYTLESAWGVSMTPTLQSLDWLLISKYYRRGREVKVGDLVSFRHPVNRETYAVKRVIGMPGDFVLRDTPGKNEVMIQVSDRACLGH
nr:mitochondrial inner membrane protease subunit 1 [Quercus suber]